MAIFSTTVSAATLLDGTETYVNWVEEVTGNVAVTKETDSVTYKSFLVKDGIICPDLGEEGSEINYYNWFYTPAGGAKTQITNANKEDVTGTTANNDLGGDGSNFNEPTIVIAAGGTAIEPAGESVMFSCEIDYTPSE